MPGTKYTNQLKSNCELCFQVYNPRLGKLVINNDMYLKAHVNCLQFVETELKRIQFHDLVAQADKINCDVCSQKRATVKCRFGSCSRSFHLSCIVPSGGEIDYVASKVSCYSHTRNGEKDSLGGCILCSWSANSYDGVKLACCSSVLHLTCAQVLISQNKKSCLHCKDDKIYRQSISGRGVYLPEPQDQLTSVNSLDQFNKYRWGLPGVSGAPSGLAPSAANSPLTKGSVTNSRPPKPTSAAPKNMVTSSKRVRNGAVASASDLTKDDDNSEVEIVKVISNIGPQKVLEACHTKPADTGADASSEPNAAGCVRRVPTNKRSNRTRRGHRKSSRDLDTNADVRTTWKTERTAKAKQDVKGKVDSLVCTPVKGEEKPLLVSSAPAIQKRRSRGATTRLTGSSVATFAATSDSPLETETPLGRLVCPQDEFHISSDTTDLTSSSMDEEITRPIQSRRTASGRTPVLQLHPTTTVVGRPRKRKRRNERWILSGGGTVDGAELADAGIGGMSGPDDSPDKRRRINHSRSTMPNTNSHSKDKGETVMNDKAVAAEPPDIDSGYNTKSGSVSPGEEAPNSISATALNLKGTLCKIEQSCESTSTKLSEGMKSQKTPVFTGSDCSDSDCEVIDVVISAGSRLNQEMATTRQQRMSAAGRLQRTNLHPQHRSPSTSLQATSRGGWEKRRRGSDEENIAPKRIKVDIGVERRQITDIDIGDGGTMKADCLPEGAACDGSTLNVLSSSINHSINLSQSLLTLGTESSAVFQSDTEMSSAANGVYILSQPSAPCIPHGRKLDGLVPTKPKQQKRKNAAKNSIMRKSAKQHPRRGLTKYFERSRRSVDDGLQGDVHSGNSPGIQVDHTYDDIEIDEPETKRDEEDVESLEEEGKGNILSTDDVDDSGDAQWPTDLPVADQPVSLASSSSSLLLAKRRKSGKKVTDLKTRPIMHGRNWIPWQQHTHQDFLPTLYVGVPQIMERNVSDFVDVNPGEKEIIRLWNTFIGDSPYTGFNHLPEAMHQFICQHGYSILVRNLYRNFVVHLCNMEQAGTIDQPALLRLINQLQSGQDDQEEQDGQAKRELPIDSTLDKSDDSLRLVLSEDDI